MYPEHSPKINDVSIDEKIVGDATIDASLANRKFKVTTLKQEPRIEVLIARTLFL